MALGMPIHSLEMWYLCGHCSAQDGTSALLVHWFSSAVTRHVYKYTEACTTLAGVLPVVEPLMAQIRFHRADTVSGARCYQCPRSTQQSLHRFLISTLTVEWVRESCITWR